VPVSDTYIAKTARSTKRSTCCVTRPRSLFERRDVIVVASISCNLRASASPRIPQGRRSSFRWARASIARLPAGVVNNQYSRN